MINPFNRNIFENLSDLLDRGSKFVPCYFQNDFSFLLYSKYFILQFLKDFNKRIFFLNNKFKNKNIDQIISLTNIDNQEITDTQITNNCDSDINKILLKLVAEKRIDTSFPLQMETVDLEFLLYKEFNDIKLNKKFNNISLEEYKAIKFFIKKKPFKICDCDKNVGISIISNENYNFLSSIHLNNITNFEKLSTNTLEDTQCFIINKLSELKDKKSISQRLFNNLTLKEYKQGSFRILPKLHKSKFSTRPIINCIKHPTSNLSLFVDAVMQPWVQSSKSYIKDSQNLIQKLEKITFEPDVKLCSFDFESLYSNIDLGHALIVISDFMADKISSDHFDPSSFYEILKLIFNNNIFCFNKQYFKQIKGVAMGSKCGPTIANIYLQCLENKFLHLYTPPFYGRYIDDIMSVFKNNFNTELLTNNNIFHNLTLNEVCSETVNFLDLNITLDKVTNRVKFSVYVKPTNTFSYLLDSSNHPSFIFKNIPRGILVRYRRICSDTNVFLLQANTVKIQLVSRGYDYDKITKITNSLAATPRANFLEYKEKKKFNTPNTFVVSKFFDFNLNDNTPFIKSLSNLGQKHSLINYFKTNIVSKIQPNIGAILINNIFSYNFNLKFYNYVKCDEVGCEICDLSLNIKYLYFKDFFLPISSFSSCTSSEIIYFIFCTKCNSFYIGESSRTVKKRISEHLYNIKKFVPFTKNYTSVSSHFNLRGHSRENFKFFILNNNLEHTNRLHLEKKTYSFT